MPPGHASSQTDHRKTDASSSINGGVLKVPGAGLGAFRTHKPRPTPASSGEYLQVRLWDSQLKPLRCVCCCSHAAGKPPMEGYGYEIRGGVTAPPAGSKPQFKGGRGVDRSSFLVSDCAFEGGP